MASTHVHLCPVCGSDALRVHRHFADRLVGIFREVRRYRCTNLGCGWEGVVSPAAADARHVSDVAVPWFVALLFLGIVAAVAVTAVTGLRAQRDDAVGRVRIATATLIDPVPGLPDGVTFDGERLAEDDPREAGSATGLALRRGCAWGVPGANPYAGSVTAALTSAGLPRDVVRKVDAMVARGIVSDRLEIRRNLIQTASGQRRFEPRIVAMGFGHTLCFNTRVNFSRGHVEHADLYDATGADGKNYAIMVPDTCHNVAVLAERAERPVENGKRVPEPGTLVLAAVAALAWHATRQPRRSVGVQMKGANGR